MNFNDLRTEPAGLLLDFGGVVFQTEKYADGRERMTRHLIALAGRAGLVLDEAFVRRSLDASLVALKHWKHASSRRLAPREMGHAEIVRDFLAADYPPAARELLVAEAGEVLDVMNTSISAHHVRPGILDLLEEARARGIPVGIVSNAHSGRSHRRILAEHGLADFFAVQVYSDEVGVRKPNPRMITLATEALGLDPAQCWYVGDTLDRDVVVGRRAGVGAVLITRAQHTDHPPFAVGDVPDATYDSPSGVLEALRASAAGPRVDADGVEENRPAVVAGAARGALLIDHGGVISTAIKEPGALTAFADDLATTLSNRDEKIDGAQVLELITSARAHYAEFKVAQLASGEGGQPVRETTPRQFWVEWFGASLSPRQRALLAVECHAVMTAYARAKSQRRMREGVDRLLPTARDLGMPVVVVSNTVSGRVVREECARHGLADLISGYIASDEIGLRKPDPQLVEAALNLVVAAPADSWFYGDKPHTDGVAAALSGIGRIALARGGSTNEEHLREALAGGRATDVVDGADDLRDLLIAARTL